jgi:hypothetical protein
LQALGDSPPLAVATPAGVGQGQGVVVCNYTAPIQKQQQRRKINEQHHRDVLAGRQQTPGL